MIENGVYPALVTPFGATGKVDLPGVARLLAWSEAAGCKGAVLAGTNGEGPSLSAFEKRDLIRSATACKGKMTVILGISTPSLDEAKWLCHQASQCGADSVLLMPPSYFRPADPVGLRDWFEEVISSSKVPVLAYNFPQKTGVILDPALLSHLTQHEQFIGAKDSSGESKNFVDYREALPEHSLFVGDETLLLQALKAGWNGTISGAANLVGNWLSEIVRSWFDSDLEQAAIRFELILPILKLIRQGPQPAANKAVLKRLGIIEDDRLRLPLVPAPEETVMTLEQQLGVTLGLRHPN